MRPARVAAALVILILALVFGGAIGVVLAAPLVASLLSKVVMEGFIGSYRAARAHVFADVQGRHYAYRDVSIAVTEDPQGYRWLRVADVRKILPNFPKDQTLKNLEPARTEGNTHSAGLQIRTDALLQWLSKAHSNDAIRFKVWVENSVHFSSEAARRSRSGATPPENDHA